MHFLVYRQGEMGELRHSLAAVKYVQTKPVQMLPYSGRETIMRMLLVAVIVFAIQPVSPGEDKETKWQKAGPKGGKISAEFPGKPTEDESESLTKFELNLPNGKGSFLLLIGMLPFKLDLDNKEIVTKHLNAGRDGGVKAVKGKLVSEKDVKLGKYPGRMIVVESGANRFQVRFYVTETKLIQVIVAGPKEFVEGADAKKFLDSLKIDE